MRKILRRIARAKMQKSGIRKMNKPRYVFNYKTRQIEKRPSFFAENWKSYVDVK